MSLLAGAIAASAAGGLLSSGLNFWSQHQNLDYQKSLQGQIFNREDNSVQRRVADLKAAGLSPVLAAGQGAGAGSAVSTQAPQFDDPSVQLQNAMLALRQEADISKTAAEKQLIASQIKATDASRDATLIRAASDAHDLQLARRDGTVVRPSGTIGTVSGAYDLARGIIDRLTAKNADSGKVDESKKPISGSVGNTRYTGGQPKMWYEK